jgi:dihydropteroate synthase
VEGEVSLYANLAGVEAGDGFPVRVVGAINVSAESFYGGSVVAGRRALERRALRMIEEGADILDVGAMSTAPYLKGAISAEEEGRRMVAAVRVLRDVAAVPLSADTQRASVAAAALEAGARIINDVSGLSHDPAMADVARAAEGVILMAWEGSVPPARRRGGGGAAGRAGNATPAPLALIAGLLRQCLRRARRGRIATDRIVLDPGLGFFRHAGLPWYAIDCLVLKNLGRLRRLGRPLLVGASRKSFIGKYTGRSDPADRLSGSLAAAAIAAYNGAALVRTHDVAATADAVRLAAAVRAGATG